MLHWDKIKSNFFVFRPGNKWKTVWTDMHTALGVIGFPYQFMYALTGIVLIVNSVLIIPFSKSFTMERRIKYMKHLAIAIIRSTRICMNHSRQALKWVTSWISWRANGQTVI
jgi:hypothetical protein